MSADGKRRIPEGSPSVAPVKQDSLITSNINGAAANDVESGVVFALFDNDVASPGVAHRHLRRQRIKLMLGQVRKRLDSGEEAAYFF